MKNNPQEFEISATFSVYQVKGKTKPNFSVERDNPNQSQNSKRIHALEILRDLALTQEF